MTEHNELDDHEREQIRDRLEQERMIESAFTNGDGPWTIVHDDWRFDNGDNGGRYMAFAQPQMRDKILSHAVGIFRKETDIRHFLVTSRTHSTLAATRPQSLNHS